MSKKHAAANKKTDRAVTWRYDDASGQVAERQKNKVAKPRAMTKEKYDEYRKSNTSAKKRSIKSGIYREQPRSDLLDGFSVELDELKEGFGSLTQLMEDYALTGNMKEIMRLLYFNKALADAGVISVQDYQKLKSKIKTKYECPPVKIVTGGQ